jgi:penicillin-binding protein 2
MQKSCDVWFYKVADTIGIDPIAEMGRSLGLGKPTGIEMVSEVKGVMPDSAYHNKVTPGGYTKGMALNTAIGQGDVNVTPLQLTMLYAAIANGGTLYKPLLVKRVEGPDGSALHEFQPQVVRKLAIPPEHRAMVLESLHAVVNEPGGTAYRSRLKDIAIAGKTGTAQVARLGKIRLKTAQMEYFQRDHAWFAAFAPTDNPEIAVVVLNEHGGHGGSDAAPTASAVIQKYFDLKNGVVAATPAEPVAQGRAAQKPRAARTAEAPAPAPPAPVATGPEPEPEEAVVEPIPEPVPARPPEAAPVPESPPPPAPE